MATQAKATVYVTSTRGASRVRITFNGKYVSFPVNAPPFDLHGQPLMSTASQGAFWRAVFAVVTPAVNAIP